MLPLENLNIPKTKINQFKKKNINSLEELVRFFPRKYMDFTHPITVSQAIDGQTAAVIVTITKIYSSYEKSYVRAIGIDEKDDSLCIMWFNTTYIGKQLKSGHKYIVCGKISINCEYNNQVQMINPMYINESIEKFKKIIPVYAKIPGMSAEYLTNCISKALQLISNPEYLDEETIKKFKLQSEMAALVNIHEPNSIADIKAAKRRIIFDTLYQYQFELEKKNRKMKKNTTIKVPKLDECRKFVNKLPFELTEDQAMAIKKIYEQMKEGKRVNTLLTADVGAGKTIIAFILMVILCENGYQAVLMAPTSVLAKQHFNELNTMLEGTPFKACFLNGGLKAKEKKEVLAGIKNGEYNMIVGTHAVIQKDVIFKNLGIAIVDEEHRFGVAQRTALIEKTSDIHYITMSATPIPRSLALTMYGDTIDILTITTMPTGRKPIKTALIRNKRKAYKFMYDEIRRGHQCYFVCPLIEKSYAESMENIDAVEDVYKELQAYFKNTNIKIAMVTGKMKEDEVNKAIDNFKNNKVQIMIATTVIEVGVNVPNSTVMVINNAERFGLAQLHQLRGRVGRGSLQSYCILISKKTTKRLQVLTTTNDGFVIANEDMKLRGSGNLIGEEQSGQNEFIDLMLMYPNLFNKIKVEIKRLYDNNEELIDIA
ncbi:ATP-dependent DNA helicase RecG [Clostridium tyrobutyricum]|jgi:ATP-dependent DNA helicase RecG|uniref:ATP-dependent DNA helicase RecG n=2 Tax=Clostridium TaxID=1485 RepID=UPI000E9CC375|nr:ATP-dependent DNA helicase RecG [Clostridium tyrobutyricum]HBG39071.1 ATP-dependent DNA helicase RecG [Clostridiaceae bacterium]